MNKINNKSVVMEKMLPLIFVYSVIVIMLFVANLIIPDYISMENLSNLLRQSAFLGIVCIGQTLVILTGGIDISVDNMLVFANVLAAEAMAGRNENIFKALCIVIFVGIITGLINGIGVYYLKVPSLVMTLASGNMLYGIAFIYCDGAPVGRTAPALSNLVTQNIVGPFTGVTFIWLALAVIVIVILKFTVFGRSIYAVGSSPVVSKYCGIKAPSTVISAYVISGAMAALVGMLLVGYTGTSYMSVGGSYEANSISAVVAGGTLITGGQGGYVGTIAGTIFMIIVSSIMTMLNVKEAVREIIEGAIVVLLLLAVFATSSRNSSAAHKKKA